MSACDRGERRKERKKEGKGERKGMVGTYARMGESSFLFPAWFIVHCS